MHWVNRGEEPLGLKDVRSKFTSEWVNRHRAGINHRPTPRWGKFREELEAKFHGLCGYCEEITRGEIDHFKPVSKFPDLVYEWSNWVFACNTCNSRFKKDKWPEQGFVDPCADSISERPEQFFDFDLMTGQLVAKRELSRQQRRKAELTVEDLGLDDPAHLKKRLARVELIRMFSTYMSNPTIERYIRRLTQPDYELSSISKSALASIVNQLT